jgi:phage shock protein PspC (stress-responsive transcriptional regulator)
MPKGTSKNSGEGTGPLGVELDLARMSLAGSRFDEAAAKYIHLLRISSSTSAESWFGLAIARLFGSENIESGFAESMLAFGRARDLTTEQESVDLTMCNILLKYYEKLGESVLILSQAAEQDKKRILYGLGLVAVSFVIGTGRHRNYFEQTIGIIGVLSGANLAANAVRDYGNAANGCLFIRRHMDAVRSRYLSLRDIGNECRSAFTEGSAAVNRAINPPQPPPRPSIGPAGRPSPQKEKLVRLRDKAVVLGLLAGMARFSGLPVAFLRIMPIAVVTLLPLLLFFANLQSDQQTDNSPVNESNAATVSIAAAGILLVLFAALYFAVGLSVPTGRSRLTRRVAGDTTKLDPAIALLEMTDNPPRNHS